MQYRLTLKDRNEKGYRVFVWFLYWLHMVAGGLFILKTEDRNLRLSVYILLGFYVALAVLYFIFRKRNKAFETFSLTLALFFANFWLKHVGVFALFIFASIFLFVNIVQNKKTRLLINDKGVEYRRLFKTINYTWADLDNLVVKDGLLTLDLKSNKLIQSEFDAGVVVIDEKEFNQFCRSHLEKANV